MSPPERVEAAMPGTLDELSRRTGYPKATVLRLITILRSEGRRVNAIADPTIVNAGLPRIEPEYVATTVFDIPKFTEVE